VHNGKIGRISDDSSTRGGVLEAMFDFTGPTQPALTDHAASR
jgi:hypothetical protein